MIIPRLENCTDNEETSRYDENEKQDTLGKRKFFNVHDDAGNSKILPSKRFCVNNDSENIINLNNGTASKTLEIIVVNGTWDTSRKIPSVIAEMHTVKLNHVEETVVSSEISAINHKGNLPQGEKLNGTVYGNVNDEIVNNKVCMDTVSDDNKSLSWLINFKVDTLFRNLELQGYGDEDCCAGNIAPSPDACSQKKQATVYLSKNTKVFNHKQKDQSNQEHVVPPSFTDIKEKKPPFTYTELIEQALEEKGELTVSEIYQWISQHFPFYKPNDDRWKNSVRHNLSINPSFRKGCKAPQGAGHLWTVAKKNEDSCNSLEKKQRIRAYLANKILLDEVQLATASIEENLENRCNPADEGQGWDSPPPPGQAISLEQSAEEILSGVKRSVEVQYLVPGREDTSTSGENRVVLVQPGPGDQPGLSDNYLFDPVLITQPSDLLNSAVRDAGLSLESDGLGAPFFITDLTPMSLGLGAGDDSAVFAEEMNFQYFQLASPV
ncbi:uncharacterized protein LOC134539219 [Bacillus rossius redtenbacheri]|uniref:uncharacterized protein LOC134539219 n=1 Tax=Bacillus rossius redtenbacheri TaxID=93214 RepID=UPI002FDD21CE